MVGSELSSILAGMDMVFSNDLPMRDAPVVVLSPSRSGARGVPPACQVVSGGRQGQLDGHVFPTAPAELPHAALFFQHSEDRFHQRFAFAIDRASLRAPQLLAHAPMHRLPRL